MSWKVRWFQNIYYVSYIRNKHYLHLFLFTISYKCLHCAASTVLVSWWSIELFVSQNISLSMSCESQCITKKHWTSPLCITMLLWKNGMKANCWGRGKRKKGFLLPKGSIGLYHIQTIQYNVALYYSSWLRSVITFTLIL